MCESDDDYAKFALFFIRHRKDFNTRFSLNDSLEYLLESVDHSHMILSFDDSDNLIACAHYWYTVNGLEPDPQGDIVFVSSVLIAREERSSRVFYKGFRDMVNRIAEETPEVKGMQFHAQVENGYLNRLYSKFTRHVGQYEGYYGAENRYAADFSKLLEYLNRGRG